MSSFDSVPNEVGVKIMEFLQLEEMDEAALVSRRFRVLRNNPGLNQTRTGTIRILLERTDGSAPLTLEGFLSKIIGWNIIFQGNRSRLRIEGIHNIVMGENREERLRRFFDRDEGESRLTGVTWLDISVPPETSKLLDEVLVMVADMAPNLEELTSNYVVTLYHDSTEYFVSRCPNMRSITWEHVTPLGDFPFNLSANGEEFNAAHNLRELYLKGSLIRCHFPDARARRFFTGEQEGGTNEWIFHHCSRFLERVDLTAVTYLPEEGPPRQIPQEGLIKLVRNSPNLTWFRSDLTIQNVNMLQGERPDVTFVTPNSAED